MEALFDRLIHYLEDPRTICVFPTEIAARSWLERLVGDAESPYQVMREDRFISWDRCKGKLFPRHDEWVPSNTMYRMIFAQTILLENTKTPFLHYIVPDAYHSDSNLFAKDIIDLCPNLKTIRECMGSLDPNFQQDISLLLDRYNQYLETYELFEPLFEPQLLDTGYLEETMSSFILIHPEIMSDMYRVREQLEMAPQITIVPMDESISVNPIVCYDNVQIELTHTISTIEHLLRAGTPAEDIAITLADYSTMRQDLKSHMYKRALPAHFRGGRPLTDYPVTRLFKDITHVITDAFSHVSMKRLLLDRSYLWKDRVKNERLIAAGVMGSCIKNYRDHEGRRVDIWKQRLFYDKGLSKYYLTLKNWLESLASAENPEELQQRFLGFQKEFLLERSDDQAAVFSYCIKELRDFTKICERIELPKGFPVYTAWLSLLERTTYVPQEPASGISIYPYEVSAGMTVAHHFIIGADQGHTSVLVDPFSILPERDRDILGPVQVDLTSTMLKVYQVSGEKTYCSYSRKTRSGEQLAPHLFMESSTVETFGGSVYAHDPYLEELAYWDGCSSQLSDSRLYPLQLKGFLRADATVFASKAMDLADKRSTDVKFNEQLFSSLSKEGDRITISPTSLDRFVQCPFSWFMGYGLDIKEVSYEIEYADARSLGTLIHTCYERLFGQISSEDDGRFLSERSDEYLESLKEIIADELAIYRRKAKALSPAVLPRIARFLYDHLPLLIEAEGAMLSGWKVDSIEGTVSYEPEDTVYRLEGRVDRVSRQDPGRATAIIDYKKKNRVRATSFTEDSAYPGSYQLPLYTYLLEKEDPGSTEVMHALYYDITKGRYDSILPGLSRKKVVVDRDRFDQVIEQMLEEIERMADQIQHADLTLTDVPIANCKACTYRNICRGRFSIR